MAAGETEGRAGARRLVAVVVTYNRLEMLKKTLARLLETAPGALEAVLVVDNACTDGTTEWLAGQDDPRLRVLYSEKNLGGAGGFETGMRLVVEEMDPDWIVVMDDDGRPEPGALEAFQALDLGAWDAVAAAVYYPDGQICDMNRPSRNPFWHARVFLNTLGQGGGRDGFHIAPAAYEGPARQVDISSFVGLFVSREAIARVGYPDWRLFVYGEDGLYTLALSQAGGRIGFVPAVRFEHDCSTFQGDRRFRPLWKIYYYHRNLLFLYRMAAGWMFWPLLLVVLPKWLLKARHHRGELRPFFRLLGLAVRHGLRRHTDVPHARVLDTAGQGITRSECPDGSGAEESFPEQCRRAPR